MGAHGDVPTLPHAAGRRPHPVGMTGGAGRSDRAGSLGRDDAGPLCPDHRPGVTGHPPDHRAPTQEELPPNPEVTAQEPGSRRGRRRALMLLTARTLGNVTAAVVVYAWLPLQEDFVWTTVAWLVAGLLVVTLLVLWQVHAILRAPYPALRAVEGLALVLPLFLLVFAAVYVLLEQTDPGSFTEPLNRVDSVYLTVTVFATVGFGDITPVTEVARLLVTGQMLADLVVLGVLFKVLFAAVQRNPARRPVMDDAEPQPVTVPTAGPSAGRPPPR
jgi:voltage-gated potassium channel